MKSRAEVFYAIGRPEETPLLADLLRSADAVYCENSLTPELDDLRSEGTACLWPPQPRAAMCLGTVARLYEKGPPRDEAAEFAAAGARVFFLPQVARPGIPPLHREELWNRRVLVTREIGQSAQLLAALRMRGAQPLALPAIRFTPPDDPRPLQSAVRQIGSYRHVLFTSRNGVDRFFTVLRELGQDARSLSQSHLAAVGEETAKALLQRGLRAAVAADQRKEGLLEMICRRARTGERALVIGPEPVDGDLVDGLRAFGLVVDPAPAYRTMRGADPEMARLVLERGAPHAALFYSPSAVEGILAAVPGEVLRKAAVVAVGPRTAQAARAAGLDVAAVADAPGLRGMLTALRMALRDTSGDDR